MKWIKNNKLTVVIIVIFVIFVILCAYVYKLFFSGEGQGAYGNRLDGIEEVTITTEQYDKIKESLMESESVVSVTTGLKVKTVNIIITVSDDVTKDNAKKLANGVLTQFETDQLAFYDIQVFIKKGNEELNDFPIIGYKQNGTEGFTWSKDRQVTVNEDE